MSGTRAGVGEADRLARVALSRTIEPSDIRVTGLVSEIGAGKALGYLGAAGEVDSHWDFGLVQELGRVDPAQALDQAAASGIRFIVPADAEWPDPDGAEDSGVPHPVQRGPVRSGSVSGRRPRGR